MDEIERKARYCSYLLRCWETQQPGEKPATNWRFSLEDPHSGRRRNFASMQMLVAALELDLMGTGGEEAGEQTNHQHR